MVILFQRERQEGCPAAPKINQTSQVIEHRGIAVLHPLQWPMLWRGQAALIFLEQWRSLEQRLVATPLCPTDHQPWPAAPAHAACSVLHAQDGSPGPGSWGVGGSCNSVLRHNQDSSSSFQMQEVLIRIYIFWTVYINFENVYIHMFVT